MSVASLPSFTSTVEAPDLLFFPVGPHVRELFATAEMQEYARLSDPLAQRELLRRRVFPALLPRLLLADLSALCERWTPDLIVSENYEFAGRVVAELRDIPHAVLKVGDVYAYAERHELVPAIDALRTLVGLPPDPAGAMLFRYLYLLNEPLSFHTDGEVLPPTTFRCRRVVFDQSGDEQRPDWLIDQAAQPTVYATAGTAVNRTPVLLESFLAALRDESVSLILTIGRARPSEFGPQPPHVHIARYIPQSMVLPACDLVLSHCGSGTMYAALDHGLPMVNVPIGMDQPENRPAALACTLGKRSIRRRVRPRRSGTQSVRSWLIPATAPTRSACRRRCRHCPARVRWSACWGTWPGTNGHSPGPSHTARSRDGSADDSRAHAGVTPLTAEQCRRATPELLCPR